MQRKNSRNQDGYVDQPHGETLGQLGLRDLVGGQPEQIQTCLMLSNYLQNIVDVVKSGIIRPDQRRRMN